MGLRSWIKRANAPKPRRPWVRPEFLGLALIAAALVGLATISSPEETGTAGAAQQRSEYVGLDPASLPLVDCIPRCAADVVLDEWRKDHPHATILETKPRYHDGRLIGYDVVYLG